MIDKRPSYRHRPIGSIAALARVLGIGVTQLHEILGRSDDLYRFVRREPKKQGGYRVIREALEPLKTVQERILLRILGAITYPDYLMGGIKDPERKRGYIRNAGRHSGATVLVSEDIADFYPSVSANKVQTVFQHLFHFPPSVSAALAGLCTRRGELAQGASTSTALANLVLFQREPKVVEHLARLGFRYSRFVDDVNVSSAAPTRADDTVVVVRAVRGLLERSGFAPKRSKQRIFRPGQRMQIHNLNVNDRASIPAGERKRIRAMVFQLERQLREGTLSRDVKRDIDRATSHASRVRALHPHEGQQLMARIRTVRAGLRTSQTA